MSPVIDAVADDLSGSPILPSGGATPTVFANDTLNGAAFLPAAVIPTIVADGGLTGVTINPDGTLTVPAATPAGVLPGRVPALRGRQSGQLRYGDRFRSRCRRIIDAVADDLSGSPILPSGGRRRRCSPTTR
ncbi:MAG: hypothetical protein IPL47_12255 [Phyllobacteriaceae bacterium]|nr:hypothetical protein [Phyllobacteriaceae bacterium]